MDTICGWISDKAARRRVETAAGDPVYGLDLFHSALIAGKIRTRKVRSNSAERFCFRRTGRFAG
jgi:hypothetical protein